MTDPRPDDRNAARERSPNYPGITLTDAVALTQKFYDKEKRTVVSAESAAKALGYASLSGASRSILASLRQYGLIESARDGIRVSDVALDIVHQPKGSPERNAALRSAALNPKLISELMASHGEASDDALKAFLITRKHFAPDGAGRFIAAFRDAMAHAGPMPQGSGDPDNGVGTDPKRADPKGTRKGSESTANRGELMEYTIQLSGDASATLMVSREIEPDDITTLQAFFDLAKRSLEKHAKARAATIPQQTPQEARADGTTQA